MGRGRVRGRGRPRKNIHVGDHQNPLPRSQTNDGSSGKEVQHQCNYCHKDISDVVRMKCHFCQDFNQCVECFYVGAEIWPHKSDHPYRVMNKLSLPIISPDWSADQELLLLEGLEMFGLYWAKVAEHVRTKNEQECVEHYNTYNLSAPNFIPEMKEADKIIAMAKGNGTSSTSKGPGTSQVENSSRSKTNCVSPITQELQKIEKQLCREVGFSAEYYIRMQAIMAEQISKEKITKKSDAHGIFVKVEPSKVDRVYDMLMVKGIAPPS